MIRVITILVLLSVAIFSCENDSRTNSKDRILEETAIKDVPGTNQNLPPIPPTSEIETPDNENAAQFVKKIIKDGRIEIQVDYLNKSKIQIDSVLKSYDAYYSNERFEDSDYTSRYYLTIRVPSQKFESLIGFFESGIGKILDKELTARDVTEEFYDLETRLENKRKYLTRYQELLKRANSIEDILKIENNIRNIEEEIESTEGRLRYLKDKVSLSTLQLTLIQHKDYKYEPSKQDKFSEKLKESLIIGWRGIVSFTLGMARIWPILFFIVFVVLGWRRLRVWRR